MLWLLVIVAALAFLMLLSTTASTLAVAERLIATYAQLLAASRNPAADDTEDPPLIG